MDGSRLGDPANGRTERAPETERRFKHVRQRKFSATYGCPMVISPTRKGRRRGLASVCRLGGGAMSINIGAWLLSSVLVDAGGTGLWS